MHVALLDPEIPGNTGSIGRLCVGTGSTLHLVGRLGFSTDEAAVRRAGLDYWAELAPQRHADLDLLLAALPGQRLLCFSVHGRQRYDRVRYEPEDILLFGSESRGLPPEVHLRFPDALIYVPMLGSIRSLNLANCVAVALFEALRQQGFPGLRLARNQPE